MQVYRGDIFYVKQFVRVTGSEQTAERPAVIVSNNTGNYHSEMCEVVYLTTKEKKPLPTHVDVMCKIPSTAMCEQIYSVSQERLGDFVRSCTAEEMDAIDKALMISLGLDLPFVTNVPSVTRVNEQEIDDLKMKLEGSERELDEARETIDTLKELCDEKDRTIESKRSHIEALSEKNRILEQGKVSVSDSDEVVRLKAQIEVLERQNERLLDRLIG